MSEINEGFDFNLATTHYKQFMPEMGIPVQASNGRPKFKLHYTLEWKIPELYPSWSLVKNQSLSVAEFREKYWAGLDRVGVQKLASIFSAVSQHLDNDTLVLMCFEKHPRDCHRGDFAMWWEDRTGIEVPELPKLPEPVR